jgi:RNA polymerase sigma-70 factor (ECF subfamily)
MSNTPATTNTNNNSELKSRSEVFVELFEADRKRLYAYIYAYMMNKAATDDIFQETSMALWHDFEKFEVGTNFSKWANGVAFNRIRVFRRNHKKLTLGLSDELIESMTDNISQDETYMDSSRWQHLQACRTLLTNTDHKLYEDFYIQNLKAQTIAQQTGRSIFAIRKSIHKLRKKLFDCIDKKTQRDAQ